VGVRGGGRGTQVSLAHHRRRDKDDPPFDRVLPCSKRKHLGTLIKHRTSTAKDRAPWEKTNKSLLGVGLRRGSSPHLGKIVSLARDKSGGREKKGESFAQLAVRKRGKCSFCEG